MILQKSVGIENAQSRFHHVADCVRLLSKAWPLGPNDQGILSWSRLIGQIGGWFKLFLGFIHAASLLFSIAGASPGNAEISISLYASSGVRPSSAVCGLTVL
jgi:hypothetical protein